jgi:GntR family transcriptional regulator
MLEPLMGVDDVRSAQTAVTAGAGVPLHRQLFLVLHDEIARGALAAGAALPTEQTLCDQFGVSRITVRRALADLADAGLIERRQGVGSFVCDQPPAQRHTGGGSFMDELRQTQFETEVDVIELDVRTVPTPIAGRLGSDRALHVLRLRRERRTSEPLMITEAWLPAGLSDAITPEALTRAPLYELLAAAGVELDRMEHEITAEIAGPRNAQLLNTAIGSPLLRVNRLARSGGTPHHYLSILLSPNRSRVLLSQSAAELESGEGMSIAHDVAATGGPAPSGRDAPSPASAAP